MSPEVLHGVGADGVGVKFPFFAVNSAVVCTCPLGEEEKSEEKRRKAKKKRKKSEKMRKKTKNATPATPTPLRTSQMSARTMFQKSSSDPMFSQEFFGDPNPQCFLKSAAILSGPISRDAAILSLRYPISRDNF